ncbi:hypothetical protein KC19_11G033900 [Ceratodon purpureus]|uniref:Uncharacterized protein n=1 Tax=Ceratodon purpureus TaxID=3225 RepID=A0A8T0GBU0_CERPU|nr:hypothetical protein KC19_11G033900 [Ceratodon purpureus]
MLFFLKALSYVEVAILVGNCNGWDEVQRVLTSCSKEYRGFFFKLSVPEVNF